MNEIDKARLATWIDGEGCITLTRHGKADVSITQCDVRSLTWIQRTAGGIITKNTSNQHKHLVYAWHLNGEESAHLLETVMPYLILKRDQAFWALKSHKFNQSGRKTNKVQLKRRARYIQKLKELKKKHYVPNPNYSR